MPRLPPVTNSTLSTTHTPAERRTSADARCADPRRCRVLRDPPTSGDHTPRGKWSDPTTRSTRAASLPGDRPRGRARVDVDLEEQSLQRTADADETQARC